MGAYRKPYPARSTCRRGALSVDGRSHVFSVASALPTRAGTMSEECRLELCAESIAPSSICAQLHGTITFATVTRVCAVGANAGGRNSGTLSAGPMYAQMKLPHSFVGYALCFTFA